MRRESIAGLALAATWQLCVLPPPFVPGVPIRLAIQLQNDRPVYDAVQQCHCQRCIIQVFLPGLEVDVRHQRRGTLLRSGINQLEQQTRGVLGLTPLQLIEAEFVHDQQVETGIITDPPWQRPVGQRRSILRSGLHWSCSGHAYPRHRQAANALDDAAFADTALANEHQVVLAADERAGGQFFDLHAVNRGGVELPVEAGQGVRIAETGLADALGNAALMRWSACSPMSRCRNCTCDRPSCSARARAASSCSARSGTRSTAKSASRRSRRSAAAGWVFTSAMVPTTATMRIRFFRSSGSMTQMCFESFSSFLM